MKIRKGDILYQCNSNDISDKDYCSYELLKRLSDRGLDCSSDDFDHEACPSFSRCWERPQKATMTKLRVTDIRIALWYCRSESSSSAIFWHAFVFIGLSLFWWHNEALHQALFFSLKSLLIHSCRDH